MRRTLALLLVLGLSAVAVYVIAANARWREQVAVASAREALYADSMQVLGVRWRLSADSADQLREHARRAEGRARAVTGRLDSLRRVMDTVQTGTQAVLTLTATMFAQDTVIREQEQEIVSLRASNEQLRAGALLLSTSLDFAVARGDSLLGLVQRAPIVQLTAPTPKTGWLVAGALVAGILVGVF
jgi:hypothetical protein